MQEYIVSARKYRPATFDSVVGQQSLTTTLKNAIHSGKLAHAYLFCGPRGVGKTTCARIFAKTINCLSPQTDGESCGQCESCKSFDEGRSMNIHELDAASNNSVEDIRELIKQVQIPPQTGRYKVFIIDEVHMLSTQAFNAFLKTLEEPPHYVIFIMATTEKHKILPTILSRCQVYDFSRITVDRIVGHLQQVAQKEGYTADEAALHLIAEKADGGMRDALSIFDQMAAFSGGNISYETVCQNLNALSTEYYFQLVDNFIENKVEPCMLLLDEIIKKGYDPGNFIAGLASHMRQLLVARDETTQPLLECSRQMRERYIQQAAKCNLQFIYRAIKLANNCDQAYRQSHNKRLQVEICLIQCAQITLEGDDEPGAGRSPIRILKPIFKARIHHDPVSRPNVSAPVLKSRPITAHTRRETRTDTIPQPAQDSHRLPKVTTFKYGRLGPSIHKEEKIQETDESTSEILELATPFSEDDVIRNWNMMINEMPKERKAMAIRMRNMPPVKVNGNCYQITASNGQIAQYLNNMKESILATMRQGLRNDTFDLQVRVAEINEIRQKISKPGLYKQLLASNHGIEELSKMLQLELI